MNKGRWASIRLVARRSVCSAVDVCVILVSLPWSAITRVNLRRRPQQVYWSREQSGKIGRHALSREDFSQRQPKNDWYSRAWDTWAGEHTSRIWPFDQLKFPRTLRDYSSGSPEFEEWLATPFIQCGWGSRRVQCHLIRSQTHHNGAARAFPKPKS